MKFFLQTFYKNGFWYKMMNFQILLNPITETDLVHFAKQMAILKVIFFCLPTYYIYLQLHPIMKCFIFFLVCPRVMTL